MKWIWMLFLARFRLSDRAVCEMSKDKGMFDDYHDYPDSEENWSMHFHTYECKRCGKTFVI